MTTRNVREFSLHEEGMWYGVEEIPPNHIEIKYHVIEKSAYDALLSDARKLAEACENSDLKVSAYITVKHRENICKALAEFDERWGKDK